MLFRRVPLPVPGPEAVSPQEVLRRIAALPLSLWSYTREARGAGGRRVRHLGPFSQDFFAAFGLGRKDTEIAVVDGIGVSLAGIQALLMRVEDLERRVTAMEAAGADQGPMDC